MRQRKPKIRVPSEHEEQAMLVKWLDAKKIPFFAVPNGAHKSPAARGKFKREGVRAGAPDIVLVSWCSKGPAVIEMKRRNASPSDTSDAQLAMHKIMRECCWTVIVAKGFDDAVKQLTELGY